MQSASASTFPSLSDSSCSWCNKYEHTSWEHTWHWSLPIRMVRVKFHKRLCTLKVIQMRILLGIGFIPFSDEWFFYITLICPLFPALYSISANVICLPVRKNQFQQHRESDSQATIKHNLSRHCHKWYKQSRKFKLWSFLCSHEWAVHCASGACL